MSIRDDSDGLSQFNLLQVLGSEKQKERARKLLVAALAERYTKAGRGGPEATRTVRDSWMRGI